MNCGKCGAEMTDEEVSLKVIGHGIYEQCAEAYLCLGDGVLLHARRGGIFLTKRRAPSRIPVKSCPECGMVAFAAPVHRFGVGDLSISTIGILAAVMFIIIGALLSTLHSITGSIR